jgi:hypothetical protein
MTLAYRGWPAQASVTSLLGPLGRALVAGNHVYPAFDWAQCRPATGVDSVQYLDGP